MHERWRPICNHHLMQVARTTALRILMQTLVWVLKGKLLLKVRMWREATKVDSSATALRTLAVKSTGAQKQKGAVARQLNRIITRLLKREAAMRVSMWRDEVLSSTIHRAQGTLDTVEPVEPVDTVDTVDTGDTGDTVEPARLSLGIRSAATTQRVMEEGYSKPEENVHHHLPT